MAIVTITVASPGMRDGRILSQNANVFITTASVVGQKQISTTSLNWLTWTLQFATKIFVIMAIGVSQGSLNKIVKLAWIIKLAGPANPQFVTRISDLSPIETRAVN